MLTKLLQDNYILTTSIISAKDRHWSARFVLAPMCSLLMFLIFKYSGKYGRRYVRFNDVEQGKHFMAL